MASPGLSGGAWRKRQASEAGAWAALLTHLQAPTLHTRQVRARKYSPILPLGVKGLSVFFTDGCLGAHA